MQVSNKFIIVCKLRPPQQSELFAQPPAETLIKNAKSKRKCSPSQSSKSSISLKEYFYSVFTNTEYPQGQTIVALEKPLKGGIIDKYFLNENQIKMFTDIMKPRLSNLLNGINQTVLFFGPEKGGKFYNLRGKENKQKGLLIQTVEELLSLQTDDQINMDSSWNKSVSSQLLSKKKFFLRVGIFCVYNDEFIDLLCNQIQTIFVQEGKSLHPYEQKMPALTQFEIKTVNEIKQHYRVSLNNLKQIENTNPNFDKDDLHMIVQLEVSFDGISNNKINFVKLANFKQSLQIAFYILLDMKPNIQNDFDLLKQYLTHCSTFDTIQFQSDLYRQSALSLALRPTLNELSETVFICALSSSFQSYAISLKALKYCQKVSKIQLSATFGSPNRNSTIQPQFQLLPQKIIGNIDTLVEDTVNFSRDITDNMPETAIEQWLISKENQLMDIKKDIHNFENDNAINHNQLLADHYFQKLNEISDFLETITRKISLSARRQLQMQQNSSIHQQSSAIQQLSPSIAKTNESILKPQYRSLTKRGSNSYYQPDQNNLQRSTLPNFSHKQCKNYFRNNYFYQATSLKKDQILNKISEALQQRSLSKEGQPLCDLRINEELIQIKLLLEEQHAEATKKVMKYKAQKQDLINQLKIFEEKTNSFEQRINSQKDEIAASQLKNIDLENELKLSNQQLQDQKMCYSQLQQTIEDYKNQVVKIKQKLAREKELKVECSEQKKTIEINLNNRINELKMQKNELEQKCDKVLAAQTQDQKRLQSNEKELQNLKDTVQYQQPLIQKLEQNKEVQNQVLSDLKNAVENQQNYINDIEVQLKTKEAALIELSQAQEFTLKEKQLAYDQYTSEKQLIIEEHMSIISDKDQQLNQLQGLYCKVQNELETVKMENIQLLRDIDMANLTRPKQDKIIITLKNKLQSYEDEIIWLSNRQKNDIKMLQANKDQIFQNFQQEQENKKELNTQIKGLQQNISILNEQANQIENQNSNKKCELKRYEQQMSKLFEENAQKEKYINKLEKQVKLLSSQLNDNLTLIETRILDCQPTEQKQEVQRTSDYLIEDFALKSENQQLANLNQSLQNECSFLKSQIQEMKTHVGEVQNNQIFIENSQVNEYVQDFINQKSQEPCQEQYQYQQQQQQQSNSKLSNKLHVLDDIKQMIKNHKTNNSKYLQLSQSTINNKSIL